ncbi:hypothetical protein Q9L58_005586 [Maublancomyces gigas]|uniref:Uncharacterized protein n=1 Tax=Discina gigas TaxID=1032678 RepID=A0ABR3GI14_9PEZI
MQFFTVTIALFAATVAAYPTETMEINGVVMQLITDPALIFTDAPVTAGTSSLRARADWPVSCGAVGDLAGYSPAAVAYILTGINYLSGLNSCTLAANSITRISCSNSAGIFVQNRETHTVVEACANFARDASRIVEVCRTSNSDVIGRRGTEFHSGNTHIRRADC